MPLPTVTLTTYAKDGKVGPHRVSPFPSQLRAEKRDAHERRPCLRVRLAQWLRRLERRLDP